ncbi:hypothetical protein ECC02_008784 [Trypanosoma cruzi]|uniref:Uncharacterized protein n=1 Tax=Trypanosoma cruzi TaxID=5693 RepID=A0A7J6XUS3_TRYCR|nr:hypothetical protein ECC02_008784 [Trypanosoma cruzi]
MINCLSYNWMALLTPANIAFIFIPHPVISVFFSPFLNRERGSEFCSPPFFQVRQKLVGLEGMPSKRLVRHGARGSQQVHMNKVKFDPYRFKVNDQKLPPVVLAFMTSLCCRRCCDILQWKVDYGKYIPLERQRKCNCCQERTVTIAYHHICQRCATERARCAKCQKPPTLGNSMTGTENRGDDTNAEGNANADIREQEEEEEEDEAAEAMSAGMPKGELSGKYVFVDQEDSDEEFWPLRGLDIRQLKQRKKELARLQEKDRVCRLRERERRTVLRGALRDPGADEGADDSDEEI